MERYRRKMPSLKKWYRILSVGLISLLILVTICARKVDADGIVFNKRDAYLNEPSQDAVVIWDKDSGEETLIINAAFEITSLSEFCWVIPIPSSQKPDVEPTDGSVFDIIKDYFPKIHWSYPSTQTNSQANSADDYEGVDVIEIKEIEIYDLAILRADDPNDLTAWLLSNGYSVPSGFRDKVRAYTDLSGGSYFIANKIDMGNEFEAPLAALEAYAPNIYKFLMTENMQHWDYWTYWDILINYYFSNDLTGLIMDDIRDGKDYVSGSFVGYIMSMDEYQALQSDLGDDHISWPEVYIKVSNSIRSTELFRMIWKLFEEPGTVGTPLKIKFFPKEPMYPLYISSLVENFGKIVVYVFAPYKAKDKNGVLDLYESISLSDSLESGLSEIGVTIPDSCLYATLLTYGGYMDDLYDDAVFVNYQGSSQQNTDPLYFYTKPFHPFTSQVIGNFNPYLQPIALITSDWISTNFLRQGNQINRTFQSNPFQPLTRILNSNYYITFPSINPLNLNVWNQSLNLGNPIFIYPSFGSDFPSTVYSYDIWRFR